MSDNVPRVDASEIEVPPDSIYTSGGPMSDLLIRLVAAKQKAEREFYETERKRIHEVIDDAHRRGRLHAGPIADPRPFDALNFDMCFIIAEIDKFSKETAELRSRIAALETLNPVAALLDRVPL